MAKLQSTPVRALATAILLLMSAFCWQAALAWGASGHRMISTLAIESLPAEIPAFLRTSKSAALIGELGREPDRGKGTGNSHDHDLDPGRYGYPPVPLRDVLSGKLHPVEQMRGSD